MFRAFFLWLSENQKVKEWFMNSKLASRLVKRFIAGNTLPEAVISASDMNKKGFLVTMDCLGETVCTDEAADKACQEYHAILDQIKDHNLKATISMKPTQLGLAINFENTRKRILGLAQKAADIGTGIEIDMESSHYVEKTLDIYKDALKITKNTRVCLQAYLFRTEKDLKELIDLGGSIRLVKGAYKEPADIAFQKKKSVDLAFSKLMTQSLSPSATTNGFRLAVATHDDLLVDLAEKSVLDRSQMEFQFLYGIKRVLQKKLVATGQTVRIYLPYGTDWYPYFMRRLAERPANFFFLIRNFFS